MVYECDQCGKALSPGVQVCPNCGEQFEDAAPLETPKGVLLIPCTARKESPDKEAHSEAGGGWTDPPLSFDHRHDHSQDQFTPPWHKSITKTQWVFVAIIATGFIIALSNSPDSTSSPASDSPASSVAITEAAEVSEAQKRFPALAQFPALAALEDKKTNDTPPLPKLRSFKYDPKLSMVSIEINMDQNLTENMAKTGLHMDTADAYIAVYQNGSIKPKITEVRVFGPLTDRLGNTKQELVYGTALDGSVANQVNWKAEKSDLQLNILPGLWTTYYNFKDSF